MIKEHQIDIDGPQATKIDPLPGPDGSPELLAFRGRIGLHLDQEMSGGQDAPRATAAYNFRHVPSSALPGGDIPFQINLEVDRSNSDVESGNEDPTKIAVAISDLATKKTTRLIQPVLVESGLPAFFSIPAGIVTSGDFDVLLHCENTAQTIGLKPSSLLLVSSYDYFELNLAKSLAIIWMMSILVITLSVFCSTFLSWPIAIVLTLLLLLGHWGVDQLADTAGPGLGRQMVNDFKMTDVAMSKVVSSGVDTLTRLLNNISRILPDTSKFRAIDDIEQGVSIPNDRLVEAAEVLAGFGIPALVLAYLVFRSKEVAP
jgi:hypothetical protein